MAEVITDQAVEQIYNDLKITHARLKVTFTETKYVTYRSTVLRRKIKMSERVTEDWISNKIPCTLRRDGRGLVTEQELAWDLPKNHGYVNYGDCIVQLLMNEMVVFEVAVEQSIWQGDTPVIIPPGNVSIHL